MNDIQKIGAVVIAILLLFLGVMAYGGTQDWYKGEKGDDGEDGVSIVGPQGPPGEDAPINQLPTITLADQAGNYVLIFPAILNSCKYTYSITVEVADADNDTLQVSFYTSWSSTGPWNLNQVYFNGDGKYTSTITYEFNNVVSKSRTNYWLVCVWDGSDIVTDIFSYTITP